MTLKVYIWEGIFQEYGPAIGVVIAKDLDEARQALVDLTKSGDDREKIKNAQPIVYNLEDIDTPIAFCRWS